MRVRKMIVGAGIIILAIGAALFVCNEKGLLPFSKSGSGVADESGDDTVPDPVTGIPVDGGKEMEISVSSYALDGYSWVYTSDDKGLVKVKKTGEKMQNGYAVGTFLITGEYPGAATCEFAYQSTNENHTVMTASERKITAVIADNMTLSYFVNDPEEDPDVKYYNSYEELANAAGFDPLRYQGDGYDETGYDETGYLSTDEVNYGIMYEKDSGVCLIYTNEHDTNIATSLVVGCETVEIAGVEVTEGADEYDSIYVAKWTNGTYYYSLIYSGYDEQEFYEDTIPKLVAASIKN